MNVNRCFVFAADVMAENTALTFKYLTPDLYEFLDATIMAQTSPEEVSLLTCSCFCYLFMHMHYK